MSQANKGKLNYRCPSCFMRDIDMDMFYDEEKKEYYCLNEQAKYRYKAMKLRVKDFNEDNKSIVFAPHEKGKQ